MKPSWKRIMIFLGVLALLVAVGKLFGLETYARPSVLKGLLLGAGAWGYILFLALFAIGCILGLPGLLFVAASVYTFGQLEGGVLAITGGVLAVTIQFSLARWAGGKALAETKSGLITKLLKGLDARPVFTVIVLRFVAQISPPVNYALAWSNIRFRDYVMGSAIGLTIVLSVIISLSSCLLPLS